MKTTKKGLKTENVINKSADKYVFVHCSKVKPLSLVIDAKINHNEIEFHDAEGEVRIPSITIGPSANISTIIKNKWFSSRTRGKWRNGCFSLLTHVKELTIKNNIYALHGLQNYVQNNYTINNQHWTHKPLSKDLRIVIQGCQTAFAALYMIQEHCKAMDVCGFTIKEYLTRYENAFMAHFEEHRDLQPQEMAKSVSYTPVAILEDNIYHFTGSEARIEKLVINASIGVGQFVCFHGKKPIKISNTVIQPAGDIRAVLQNVWYDGRKGNFFSLLHFTRAITIVDNSKALLDLLNYLNNNYDLNIHWRRQLFAKNPSLLVSCAEEDLSVIQRLRQYFSTVEISALKIPLKINNILDGQYQKVVFTNCANVSPQSLLINTNIYSHWVSIESVDAELHVPMVVIGEAGDLGSIIYNKCLIKDDEERKYSLISFVEMLTIKNNTTALRDFVSYIAHEHQAPRKGWEFQLINKNILLRVQDIEGCDKEINKLKEYFGYMIFNDVKVLSDERRLKLMQINVKYKEIVQKQIVCRQKEQQMKQVDSGIVETTRRIEQARSRLNRRRQRFRQYLELAE